MPSLTATACEVSTDIEFKNCCIFGTGRPPHTWAQVIYTKLYIYIYITLLRLIHAFVSFSWTLLETNKQRKQEQYKRREFSVNSVSMSCVKSNNHMYTYTYCALQFIVVSGSWQTPPHSSVSKTSYCTVQLGFMTAIFAVGERSTAKRSAKQFSLDITLKHFTHIFPWWHVADFNFLLMCIDISLGGHVKGLVFTVAVYKTLLLSINAGKSHP